MIILSFHNPTKSLAIILELMLIRVILTAPGFGLRSMIYLDVLSSDIPLALHIPTSVWYQSVGRQRNNHPTLIQSILFRLMKLIMDMMIHFGMLVIRTPYIKYYMLMISYTIPYSLGGG